MQLIDLKTSTAGTNLLLYTHVDKSIFDPKVFELLLFAKAK